MSTRFVSPGLGYDIEDNSKAMHEGTSKNQKLQRAISEMGTVPGFDSAKRAPVTYGADGLPDVPEPALENKISEYVEEQNYSHQRSAHDNKEVGQVRETQHQNQHQNTHHNANHNTHQNMQQNPTQPAAQKRLEAREDLENKLKMDKHPVVEKLLNKFGLVNQKKYHLKIYASEQDTQGMDFTLAPITDELASWALEVTRQALDKDLNVGIAYYESLLCCSCVLAIDNVPVHEAFKIRQTEEEKQKQETDLYSLSNRVRKISGQKLMEIFWTDTKPVLSKLTEFYEQTITRDMSVKSSLDIERSALERYVCPFDGCTVVYFEKPNVEDEQEQPYYCKVHSAPMVKSLSSDQANNYPLA